MVRDSDSRRADSLHGAELTQRLMAILAADAAGYSRLMAGNERATVIALDAARAVFKTRIESNRGRVVDMAGDSVLAVFPTAIGAVVTALAVQKDLQSVAADVPEEQRLHFRVGLHIGDVIEKHDGTVYGDGVNIASRLQALAEPGGVIVSESIRAAVRGKVEAGFVDRGEQRVKNIPAPVRAYSVARDTEDARRPKSIPAGVGATRTVAREIRLGRFELRPDTRELCEHGRPLRIGERAFDILLALVDAGGRPLSRDALFERAWPGRVVLDDNLKVQVMALRRLLGRDAVITVPGQGYRLGLPLDAPPSPGDTPDLIGRAADLAGVAAQLRPGRLVSVVGPGGIGKTRLAQAAAAAAAASGAFADGTAFVELAPLADARLVPGTVARALGLPPGSSDAALLAALRPLALLLVLDNAEHLLDAVAAFVGTLRDAAPSVAVLVTSQEPLGLPAEAVVRLDGLSADASAALFDARARAFDPDFAPAGDDAAALARICGRLDGIPLALELAAARVPLLGVQGVERKLGEALALLSRGARGAPPRQQTLRAALQWSHALLDDAQKTVFRRLAVFSGSFAPETAEAVAAGGALDRWAVLDALQSLAEKSLLQRLPADAPGPRLQLLETTRLFASERLDESGEAGERRRRHAEAIAKLFEAAEERYNATPALPWLNALLPELPNLRAAVEWALGVDGDEGLAIRLCAAAGSFWAMTGQHAESGPPLKRLASRVDSDGRVPLETRARFWLAVANRGADYSFSWTETADACERAVALAREGGFATLLHRALGHGVSLAHRLGRPVDPAAVADEMRAIEGDDWSPLQRRSRRTTEAFAVMLRGDWVRYGELQRQELQLLRDAGDEYRAWFAAHRLALADMAQGRADAAVALMQPAVDEIRRAGLQRHCWQQVALLAVAMIEAGHAPPGPVQEAVRLMRGAGAMTWSACHLGEWLAQQGRHADAARLIGWATRRLAERGESATEQGERARARALAAIVAAAGDARAAAWQAEGERWNDDDAAQALLS